MAVSTKETGSLDLAEQLRPVLLRLSRQLRRETRGDLSPLDAMLLATIRHNDGIGVSELADTERMSAPTMSVHVKRLEEAGWILRDVSSCTDKRRTSLKITRAGEKALEAIRRQRNDWLAERLAALSDKERQSLLGAIAPLTHLAGEKA
jgi:DNA-binding MarR family transcriptional regulator